MLEQLHKRYVALLACAALLIATTGFLVHGYRVDAKNHNETHCEFCAQLAGGAGTPATIQPLALIGLVYFLVHLPPISFPRVIRLSRANRSRAPPRIPSI
jgi:DUF2946 family protein